mmetsp:Transcript_20306/g.48105  ORF Transcript_20306/g.48105 Transcript_20306/m.48105 type:complete len:214 (+) Transcript_20306:35-676(+)
MLERSTCHGTHTRVYTHHTGAVTALSVGMLRLLRLRSQTSPGASSDLDVLDDLGLVDALHDAGEDLARAELVALLEAAVDEALHDALPLHRRRHLLGEDLLNDIRVGVRLGVDVGDDGDARLDDGHLLEHGLERGHCRLHEVRVEGAGHRQLDGHARLELGLGDLRHLGHGGGRAGAGVVTVAQVVGDLYGLARRLGRRLAQRLHLVGLEADD